MDLQSLASKVRISRLLQEDERRYWLAHLTTMTPSQLAKLEGILMQAAALPWNKQMQTYMSIANKAFSVLTA